MITRSTGYTFNVYHGLSTDTKPTVGVVNGDKFVEIDTGDKYVFNGEDLQWVSESGGGGGSGGGVFLVTGTWDVDYDQSGTGTGTIDTTGDEIRAKIASGTVCFFSLPSDNILAPITGSDSLSARYFTASSDFGMGVTIRIAYNDDNDFQATTTNYTMTVENLI